MVPDSSSPASGLFGGRRRGRLSGHHYFRITFGASGARITAGASRSGRACTHEGRVVSQWLGNGRDWGATRLPRGLLGRFTISLYNQPLADDNCKFRPVIDRLKNPRESAKLFAPAASHYPSGFNLLGCYSPAPGEWWETTSRSLDRDEERRRALRLGGRVASPWLFRSGVPRRSRERS